MEHDQCCAVLHFPWRCKQVQIPKRGSLMMCWGNRPVQFYGPIRSQINRETSACCACGQLTVSLDPYFNEATPLVSELRNTTCINNR